MDCNVPEPINLLRFIRQHLGRIVIGFILIAMVYGAMSVMSPFLREDRIAQKIDSLGGYVTMFDDTPVWIPQFLRHRIPVYRRIGCVFLGQTQATDAELEQLKGMMHLDILELDETQVTDAGLEHLKGMSSLTSLYLIQTQVNGSGLEHLKGLKNLRILILDRTKIADAGLENLKGLASLQNLSLDETHVTDAGMEHLKGLIGLQYLSLSETQVTDAGLEQLKSLTSLKRLKLNNTPTTKNGKEMLRGGIAELPYRTKPMTTCSRRSIAADSAGSN